ncbi:hypothetical protein Vretimale_12858 [Volvox reticuliferus]|uniref:Uncharacterized protein n=1 Tax=Volvox reticuliferus TaxID=1737510 RepID=A0A8J4CH16_9CHLO|nr:hypothetical protein Vretifemale_9236 [Volvox reticuliferus]GIM08956.1 hypothetical protein Vretimale_12858 [Volvox reticuliferus]
MATATQLLVVVGWWWWGEAERITISIIINKLSDRMTSEIAKSQIQHKPSPVQSNRSSSVSAYSRGLLGFTAVVLLVVQPPPPLCRHAGLEGIGRAGQGLGATREVVDRWELVIVVGSRLLGTSLAQRSVH